jgi:hypothetical protein
MHEKKRGFTKAKIETEFSSPTFTDTYCAIDIRHLQTAFCLLMLGYVLSVASFVTEIVWHRFRSKKR